jgi:8-oxo-dGTP pyrophosphatase MutT (NUDIX family)
MMRGERAPLHEDRRQPDAAPRGAAGNAATRICDIDHEKRPPVRPRDAASLILHRTRGGRHEVLMGRRPRAARFMPGVYVFPGGAVEAEDRLVRPASPLSAHVTELLKVGGRAARARALAVTAVRETFEETGLLLGTRGDAGLPDHPAWGAWCAQGLAPHLACLELTGRAITPARLPIRFHARFFLADARHASGAIGGDGELEDIAWVPLQDANTLPIADVQKFFIEHLRELFAARGDAGPRPVFTHRRGARYVRYG